MATEYKNDTKQGTWFVDGIPMGGFNVHKIEYLNDELR